MNWSSRRNEAYPNLKALYHSARPPVRENVFSTFLRLQWIFHVPLKAACYASLGTKVIYELTSKVQFSQVCLSFKAEHRNHFKGSPRKPRTLAIPTCNLGTSCPDVTLPRGFDPTLLDSTVMRLFSLCSLTFCWCFFSLQGNNLVRTWQENPFYLFVVVIQSARLADDQRPY